MKRVAYPALGLLLVLLALPSRSAAKTKIELKDAQGKSVGDVVIWDEIATMHRGAADAAPEERRIMIRTIVHPN